MGVYCFTSHVDEHRTLRGLWKRQGIPCLFKIPTLQQSPEKETPFVCVPLANHVTLATARYSACLFEYVTIGLARHNRTYVSQSEGLLVKPQRLYRHIHGASCDVKQTDVGGYQRQGYGIEIRITYNLCTLYKRLFIFDGCHSTLWYTLRVYHIWYLCFVYIYTDVDAYPPA